MKFLEENGIGRPSTYAEILRKIEYREYVRKKDRRFIPTALGRTVIELLIPFFDDFFETSYTARMEERLDDVEEGKISWKKALAEFDKTFTRDRDRALARHGLGEGRHPAGGGAGAPHVPCRARDLREVPQVRQEVEAPDGQERPLRRLQRLSRAARSRRTSPIPEEDVMDATELESTTCEECGSPMKLRQSRTGSAFLGCTAYPKCRNVVNVVMAGGKAEARPDEPTGETCPESGHPLVRRHGRFGAYVACSGYPACKYKPPKPVKDTGVRCPKDGGDHRGAARPVPPLLRMRQLSQLRLHALRAADPRGVPAVRQSVPPPARAKGRKRPRLRQRRMRLREAGGQSSPG